MQDPRSSRDILGPKSGSRSVSGSSLDVLWDVVSTHCWMLRCIDHAMHRGAAAFIKALGIGPLLKAKAAIRKSRVTDDDAGDEDEDGDGDGDDIDIDISMEIDATADDVEAMDGTMVVDFTPGDTIGKALAFVNQMRLSCEGTRDYLDEILAAKNLSPLELRLWVRTRWGSMSNFLEVLLRIQKVSHFLCSLLTIQVY
jgi:hypothetical protein